MQKDGFTPPNSTKNPTPINKPHLKTSKHLSQETKSYFLYKLFFRNFTSTLSKIISRLMSTATKKVCFEQKKNWHCDLRQYYKTIEKGEIDRILTLRWLIEHVRLQSNHSLCLFKNCNFLFIPRIIPGMRILEIRIVKTRKVQKTHTSATHHTEENMEELFDESSDALQCSCAQSTSSTRKLTKFVTPY